MGMFLLNRICDHNPELIRLLDEKIHYYALISGPSYGTLGFEDREEIRTGLREKLESFGIRFPEYIWVWDEDDRCLLLVGEYEKEEDAIQCMKRYEPMGFKTCMRTSLPGDENTG